MKWIEKIIEVAAVVFMFLITLTVALQLFSRFFGSPFTWTEELTNIFLVYGTFMGGSLAYYKGRGFKITILVDSFPPKVKKVVDSIIILLSIILLTFVMYSILLYMINTGSSTTPLLGISRSMILFSMPIGYLLILIRYIKELRETVVNNSRKEESYTE